jgi:hypothetical protein
VNRDAWREAYRWQRQDAAVPWVNRAGVALLLTIVLILAGLTNPIGQTWLLVGVFSAAWWGLVAAGIWLEVRIASARLRDRP